MTVTSSAPLSVTDALIYIMVIAAASDSAINDREIDRFAALVSRWPVFETFDPAHLPGVARACVERLNTGDLDTIVADIAESLPARLQEVAYAIAVEITVVDLMLNQEELRLLEMLRDAFSIDRLVTAAIETSARIRHRKP